MKQSLTARMAGQIIPDRISLWMITIDLCQSVFIGGYMNDSG